jgi:hypothetical protein
MCASIFPNLASLEIFANDHIVRVDHLCVRQ